MLERRCQPFGSCWSPSDTRRRRGVLAACGLRRHVPDGRLELESRPSGHRQCSDVESRRALTAARGA
eukprot:5667465-Prymnesium_polylepis.2